MEPTIDKNAVDWPTLLDKLKQKESLSSDAKLAESLGVTRGYICSVRKERKVISLELAKVIFSRLGKTFNAPELERLFIPAKVRRFTSNLKSIRNYVVSRANGHCQLCGIQAPFTGPDGFPYLEVHHVVHIRDGGEDSPSNLVALCPNCHRKMEISPTPADEKKLHKIVQTYQKSDTA